MSKEYYRILQAQTFNDNRAERYYFPLKQLGINQEIKQINYSIVQNNGQISCWHKHHIQTDFFFCVKGLFQVGLAIPDDNVTFNNKSLLVGHRIEWIYLSERDDKILQINPYVYHGYKALKPDSIMTYFLTQQYNPNDEFRAKAGDFGENWGIENK